MLDRIVRGEVPRKHHIVFKGPDGALRWEECYTRIGFEGAYSILYHLRRPHTQVFAELDHGWEAPVPAPPRRLAKRHYETGRMNMPGGAPVDARVPLLFNADIVIGYAEPDAADPVYVANADGDDLVFIFEGTGLLRTPFGDLRYEPYDYVCVPRSVVHRWIPDDGVKQRWLTMECAGSSFGLLSQWRNDEGQLRMDAPYCHRDFRRPEFVGPMDEGIRGLVVKTGHRWSGFKYQDSPLDVVGWDGVAYPWIFPMMNFQARAGLVHLPPTWHGTFKARNAIICSFVPRAVDFHPEAIPCPYPHASPDCDEFLFYCKGNFTSRRGVGPGSISHHPVGIPHGPHPGAYEASIGHRETTETAVMIDTFSPMQTTAAAIAAEDPGYQDSFV